MGCAIPYAIAAKFCFPDRVAIAFVGDGAMQMLGINGLITIAKYWREWKDPRFALIARVGRRSTVWYRVFLEPWIGASS